MTTPDAGHLDVERAELALYLRDGSIVHLTNVQAVGTIVPVRLPDAVFDAADVPPAVVGLERLDLTLTGFAWPDPETGRVASVHLGDPEDAHGALSAAHGVLEGLAQHGAVYQTPDRRPAPQTPTGAVPE
jgi:hypothetical protein